MRNFLVLSVFFATIFATKNSLAQCSVLAVNSSQTITCGDLITIQVTGTTAGAVLSEDFNSMTHSTDIQLTQAAVYTNPCGPSLDGTPSLWMGMNGAAPRTLETVGYDLSCGAIICFDLDFASDDPCGNCTTCEDPDLGSEGVLLQYSADGGSNWVDIFMFDPVISTQQTNHPFYSWDNYCFDLPPAGWTSNTKIRWTQQSLSGSGFDHWGIDNISLYALNCVPDPGYYYYWDGVLGDSDSTFWINTSTTYNIMYTNGLNDTCYTSVDVTIDPFIPSISYPANAYCQTDSSIFPFIGGSTGGVFTSTGGLVVDSVTGEINPIAASPGFHDIVYKAPNGVVCDSMVVTIEVVVEDAGFYYDQNLYCSQNTTILPTVTGDPGGTFSASGGLTVNSSTGSFNPSLNSPGNYVVTHTTPMNCDTATFAVEIIQNPIVGAGNDTTIFLNELITLTAFNPDGALISWNSGVIDGIPFAPPVGVNMYVVIANSNGCISTDQIVVTVIDNSGIETNDRLGLNIYPNPSSGKVYLTFEGNFSFEVFDAAGKLVLSDTGTNSQEVDLGGFEKGIYSIRLQSGESSYTEQILLK